MRYLVSGTDQLASPFAAAKGLDIQQLSFATCSPLSKRRRLRPCEKDSIDVDGLREKKEPPCEIVRFQL